MNRVSTKYKRRMVYSEQKGLCNSCHEKIKIFCLDHIIPLCLGGTDNRENLQVLCIPCHLEKTKGENYGKPLARHKETAQEIIDDV